MVKITPAILQPNLQSIESAVSSVLSLTDFIQIDFVDGSFAGINQTWPFPVDFSMSVADLLPDGLPYWREVDYEFDLIIKNPEQTLEWWLEMSPSSVVIHYETVSDWSMLFDLIKKYQDQVAFGLSFDNQTSLQLLWDIFPKFDYVQCMGIDKVGFQGQPFSNKVLENIKLLKQKWPNLILSVDGAVNKDTLPQLISAGADRLVVGSAIFSQQSPSQAMQELLDLI